MKKFLKFLPVLGLVFPIYFAEAAFTENQIRAVLNLISAFGVEQAIVKNVEKTLRGTVQAKPRYSRTPSGASVTSPVTFSVSAGSVSDLGITAGDTFWGVGVADTDVFSSSCISTSVLSHDFTISLPLQSYLVVSIISGDTKANCEDPNIQRNGIDLEGKLENVIFKVAE